MHFAICVWLCAWTVSRVSCPSQYCTSPGGVKDTRYEIRDARVSSHITGVDGIDSIQGQGSLE